MFDDQSSDQPIRPFVSSRRRARVVVALLGLLIVLSVVSLLSNQAQLDLLRTLQAGEPIADGAADSNDLRQGIIGIVQRILALTSVIAFLAWVHRAYKNLPALGARDLRTTPGWAIAGFLIPIVCIWRPYQTLKDVWRESDPEFDRAFHASWNYRSSGQALVGLWWFCYVIQAAVGKMADRLPDANPTLDSLIRLTQMQQFSDFLDIPAAILGLILVRKITARQESKVLHRAADVFT